MTEPGRTDYLLVFFSLLTMIGIAVIGMALLSSCSMSFNREEGNINGDKAHKTNFTISTKV